MKYYISKIKYPNATCSECVDYKVYEAKKFAHSNIVEYVEENISKLLPGEEFIIGCGNGDEDYFMSE